jgi:hypothetical protein
VSVQLRIHLDDATEFEDLREWMGGHDGVIVDTVRRPPGATAQGSVWDFLSVACETGGPVVAAVRALQLWIESRVTAVQVAIGDKTFTVRTTDAAMVLPRVEEMAVRMLESETPRHDEDA